MERALKITALKVTALVLALVVVAVAAVVGRYAWYAWVPDLDVRPAAWDWPEEATDAEVDALARRVLKQMTLEEKIAQMSGDGIDRFVGGLLFHGFPRVVYSGANTRLGVPPLAFTDGPRGVVTARATAFPVAIARAATFDLDLEGRVGDAIGKEVRAAGANYFAGLCVNVLRHPSWGRAEESYGEDPWLQGEMGLALMRAVQVHNVMVCAKHFALNNVETSRYEVDVRLDERTLREVYLPQFEKLVKGGVDSVMSAYNKVRGVYCGHSRELLTDVLRGDWGFAGIVTSDWDFGLRDPLLGIRAGLDVEMPGPRQYHTENVLRLLATGEVDGAEIDALVTRILKTKLRWATRVDQVEYGEDLIAHPEHTALAREVAEKSAVLLRNDDLLPLDRAAVRKLAVVGALADADNTGDHGSSWVRPPYVVTPLAGLRAYLGDAAVVHADGSDLDAVRRLAAEADAVVVVAGFRPDEAGEYISLAGTSPRSVDEMEAPLGMAGGDRYPLGLEKRDLAVIDAATAASDRVVVALVAGSAVTMESWKDRVGAILLAWNPGLEGGNALARLLFGEVNPSAKLPLTIPHDVSELPPFDPFARELDVGYYHGYTLFDREGKEPAFPFGFGLSYTTFAFDGLEVLTPEVTPRDVLEVRVDVTNTGPVAGAETAQLYVGFENSAVDRPVKLLRGFDKVYLEPGETRTVTLRVMVSELGWYDPDARAWVVEEMEHSVFVGPSSRAEDLLRGSFVIR